MKKVLIITNIAHASPRVPGLIKYLHEFGWEAILLTHSLDRYGERVWFDDIVKKTRTRIIETPYWDVIGTWKKRLGFKPEQRVRYDLKATLHRTFQRSLLDFVFNTFLACIAYPDEDKGWLTTGSRAGERLLENERVDVILSSSSPVTAHLIAQKLKERYQISWIADFRDLWTQNYAYPFPFMRKFFERRLEVKTIRSASLLVTVATALAQRLQELHKVKEIHVVTNGFDPETTNFTPATLTKKFTICYTGQVYPHKQNVALFFSALSELISDGSILQSNVEVNFYGVLDPSVRHEIETHDKFGVFKYGGKLSRDEVLTKQRTGQILLVLNWEDTKQKGVYTTKLFEYLAARRPILASGGMAQDVVAEVLAHTQAGIHCPSKEDIKRSLTKWYQEYLETGTVTYRGNQEKIEQYSYREMARKFAALFNQLIAP